MRARRRTKAPGHCDCTHCTVRVDGDSRVPLADQSQLDRIDGQRRRCGLSRGALPGSRLFIVRSDCDGDDYYVQRHGAQRFHELQLSYSRG